MRPQALNQRLRSMRDTPLVMPYHYDDKKKGTKKGGKQEDQGGKK